MAQTTNDIKNGSVLNLDGQLWTVIKFQHVKPGKGPAFVRTTIKNVLSGKIVDKTFNAGMKMEFETVDNRNLQYSYEDGDNFVRPSSCSKAPTASCPSTTAPRCPSSCRLPSS